MTCALSHKLREIVDPKDILSIGEGCYVFESELNRTSVLHWHTAGVVICIFTGIAGEYRMNLLSTSTGNKVPGSH